MNLAAASTFHWQTLAQWQFEDESAASVPSVLLFYVPVQWGVCGGGSVTSAHITAGPTPRSFALTAGSR